jgi:glycosyltransferase involved in cell wall biosynthesis
VPVFSIITATLQRDSLLETCRSIDQQTGVEWEHIVLVDQEEFKPELLDRIRHSRRTIVKCPFPHGNGGNSCRHNGWHLTTGEWVAYMDDDNYYADDRILADLWQAVRPLPEIVKWALFPITRLGLRFYCDPPRSCHVDTMNFILRREIAQWPNINVYGSDGVLVDRLMEEKVTYAAFPDFRPIAVLPKISFCK